jgi:hypothetical protein
MEAEMMSRLGRAVLLAVVVGLAVPLTSFAESGRPAAEVRAAGQITAVDPAASSFTLHARRGEDLTFQVNEETKFHSRDGQVGGLDDLEIGMAAAVGAEKLEDGTLLAVQVAVGSKDDHVRAVGLIAAVVPGQETFSIESSDGKSWEFQTGERTRFRSRDGSVDDIHDLKKGMPVLVLAIKADGGWLALLVAAGNPEAWPPADEALVGKIVGLGTNTLTIDTRNGDSVTVVVDESTVFRSRGGAVDSFDDLEVGMAAAIGAREDRGRLIAAWIAIGKPGEDLRQRIEDRLRDRQRDRRGPGDGVQPTDEAPVFGV